ncbi:uncharacterized protein LOC115919529 [Strongylocentrotus purpuratus]|uniref:HAT C-terminal dimerisation domain-containing protein n=1 Tax=Strongylocentrotus purpuratus TaxID=7668 RepID=A0A7M7N0S7_STRPU|nr:uncharacterized protein LOC115919529 [Strongylocentrotus purpuratus]
MLKDAGVDLDSLGVEWDLFKARTYHVKKSKKGQQWTSIIPDLQGDMPNICCLMDLLLSIPASSAEAERGFSRLKLVKTSLRTSLKDENVTNSMLIVMHSPSVAEFSPQPAIDLWCSSGNRSRRPEMVHRRPGPHSDSTDSSDHSDLDEDFDVVEFDEVDELVDEVDSHSDTDSG